MRIDVCSDTRRARRGQAAVEFAICAFVFALVVSALVGFAPVFLKNVAMLSDARTDAGIAALDAAAGATTAGGSAAGVTRYAHPDPAVLGGGVPASDPWADAAAALPAEPQFPAWCADAVTPITLVLGSARKSFRFTLTLGGEPLFSDEGQLAEDVWMPALGGVKAVGGGTP